MKKRIISMLVVALMAVMMISTNVLASSGSGTVTVGYNSRMMQAKTDITRTGKYSYASIKATSVYPTGDYKFDTYINYEYVRNNEFFIQSDASNEKIQTMKDEFLTKYRYLP